MEASVRRPLEIAARDVRPLAILLAPLAILLLTRAFGGAAPTLPYLAVFVVLLAGRWYGSLVGALTGAYAGLLLGSFGGLLDMAPAALWHGRTWLPLLFFVALGLAWGFATQQFRSGIAKERVQRQELARVHARTLMVFANLVAHRDQPTAFHCERVAENARTLGRLYGLREHELNALYWAGMLHDVGKIATPAAILLKEGALTGEEYDVIKEHPRMGAEVLLDISPRFHQIAEGVQSHHERWDGSGYPLGLSGEGIPLFGRLLAVVDVFEAMTSPRPYRGPLPQREVMQHLRERAGTDFDPEVVSRFASLYRRGLVHTYEDGYPAPIDLSSGIFSTGFWREQGEPDVVPQAPREMPLLSAGRLAPRTERRTLSGGLA